MVSSRLKADGVPVCASADYFGDRFRMEFSWFGGVMEKAEFKITMSSHDSLAVGCRHRVIT